MFVSSGSRLDRIGTPCALTISTPTHGGARHPGATSSERAGRRTFHAPVRLDTLQGLFHLGRHGRLTRLRRAAGSDAHNSLFDAESAADAFNNRLLPICHKKTISILRANVELF